MPSTHDSHLAARTCVAKGGFGHGELISGFPFSLLGINSFGPTGLQQTRDITVLGVTCVRCLFWARAACCVTQSFAQTLWTHKPHSQNIKYRFFLTHSFVLRSKNVCFLKPLRGPVLTGSTSRQLKQRCRALALSSPQAPRSHTLLPPPHSRCRTSGPRRAPWPRACCTSTCPRLSPDWRPGPFCCMYWKQWGTGTYKETEQVWLSGTTGEVKMCTSTVQHVKPMETSEVDWRRKAPFTPTWSEADIVWAPLYLLPVLVT